MRFFFPLLLIALLAGCQASSDTDKLPDACYQPPESGMCKAAFQRYYYDQQTDSCKTFIWGGCKGNVPFETRDACMQTCDANGTKPAAQTKPYYRRQKDEQ